MTARLFPTAHPDADVGANEILWLAGIVDDSSGSILKRYCVRLCAYFHCILSLFK